MIKEKNFSRKSENLLDFFLISRKRFTKFTMRQRNSVKSGMTPCGMTIAELLSNSLYSTADVIAPQIRLRPQPDILPK
jgi:hypothetical protein